MNRTAERSFAVTYDYLCPFACIANDVVVAALRDGAPWDVEFQPFSLSQVHVEDGDAPVWDRPAGAPGTSGVLAHTWALAVADVAPDGFLDFHSAMFAARHTRGQDLNDPSVIRRVAVDCELDSDALSEAVASGKPLTVLAERHTAAVEEHAVFGVPTFIMGGEAVFVRLMRRDRADLERILDLVELTNLNEFKRTTIPR